MGIFDIVGPVMIGPSSSHTAGAAKIGLVARTLLSEDPLWAMITLYGSFAKTGRGHGTDKAIVGGLLGLSMDDPDLKNSFELAEMRGLTYQFVKSDEVRTYQNTAKIEASSMSKSVTVHCASLGGGMVMIRNIDGIKVDIMCQSHTIILPHIDKAGVIAAVTGLLADDGINIGAMRTFRSKKHGDSVMVLEVDSEPSGELLDRIGNVSGVERVTALPPLPA